MDFLEQRKLLTLWAISASSAFIVTILIVVLCVGCQRQPKRKCTQTSEGNYRMKMDVLRQSKLNAMSKSDTCLHEMHRLPCSVNDDNKNRPISMDLILHSQCSVSDLCSLSASCQQPQTVAGSECKKFETASFEDDGLYECVGIQYTKFPALLHNLSRSPVITENRQDRREVRDKVLNKDGEKNLPVYASISKVRKPARERMEKVSEQENASEACTSNIYKQTSQPNHCPNFTKKAVFNGNGAQYIWKPPDEGYSYMENYCSRTEISEMYSTVCKTSKKKHQESIPQQINGQTAHFTVPELEEGLRESMSQPQDEHCYEAVGEKTWSTMLNSDPAYATVDPYQKRERKCNDIHKLKKKASEYFTGHVMTCENFYETIGDVKQVTNSSSATTVLTLNDSMEMYVTGL